jgi:hypothetical protein
MSEFAKEGRDHRGRIAAGVVIAAVLVWVFATPGLVLAIGGASAVVGLVTSAFPPAAGALSDPWLRRLLVAVGGVLVAVALLESPTGVALHQSPSTQHRIVH